MLNDILRPANLFTSSSLFCGFYSIVLSAGAGTHDQGAFHAAAVLILFAGLFDMLDGPIARITRTSSEFGRHLDSFSDLVSFGIAPGVLLYKWGLAGFELFGFAIAFMFVLSGAFRLSRFNTGVDDGEPGYSRGLTITCAGGTVAVLVMHHHRTGMNLLNSQLVVLLFTLFLTYLMVSNIRFRTLKGLRFKGATLAVAGLFAFAFTITVIVLDATLCMVGIATLYIGGGLLESAFTRRRRRWELSILESIDESMDDDVDEPLLEALDDEDNLAPEGELHTRPRRRWWPPFRRP